MKYLFILFLLLSACAQKSSNNTSQAMKFRTGPACIQSTNGSIFCFHQSNIEQVYGP